MTQSSSRLCPEENPHRGIFRGQSHQLYTHSHTSGSALKDNHSPAQAESEVDPLNAATGAVTTGEGTMCPTTPRQTRQPRLGHNQVGTTISTTSSGTNTGRTTTQTTGSITSEDPLVLTSSLTRIRAVDQVGTRQESKACHKETIGDANGANSMQIEPFTCSSATVKGG